MEFRFSKMHGLGNDFVVIDAIQQNVQMDQALASAVADRHFGVGCDQILLVEPSRDADTDFYYRIFNADGSEVENCGNGARCFARFVQATGLCDKARIVVGTLGGPLVLDLLADQQVRMSMTSPDFEPQKVPFVARSTQSSYNLELPAAELNIGVVSVGNPHAVTWVTDVDHFAVATMGPQVVGHARFPEGVNAGFAQIVDQEHIRLRVYERGSGETLACGSGACAAVAVGRQQGLLAAKVSVELPGGTLVINWPDEQGPLTMTGPAAFVYEGVWNS